MNSEGARAVWDPLTLKTNTPKSSSKIKLYTEYKHLEKEYELNREVKTKERKFLHKNWVEKASQEMSETKLPYFWNK